MDEMNPYHHKDFSQKVNYFKLQTNPPGLENEVIFIIYL